MLNLQKGNQLAESLNFFIYDIPKIYFLLLTVVFVVAFIRSFLPPQKIKSILSHRHEIFGNISAAVLGIFVPFCTCSAIPLFIGMLESGVPLGVTMSFLVSSPMINEVALVLLWGLFGWKIAITYIASGLVIAVFSGFIIGRLKMEKYVEKFALPADNTENKKALSFSERIINSFNYSFETFKYLWFYILIGVGVGALIHGYVPINLVSKLAGGRSPLAVIIAVILGVPLYANCAGAIPVVQAILGKGMALGTSLAFMMAVTGLSLPEFFILRKVLKPQLLVTFFSVVAVGIIIVGNLFNIIF
ncbi:MAG: permease [Candidatus Saganbacteria bacterium]|uniref:Permease n=1 Tax=Candidatus Saganbacteria bacterium TaxID=2575572 RepID=A0A833P2P8_UNCSA|nr:MAG: permease [Candidatus Saganbacteria bacterium]